MGYLSVAAIAVIVTSVIYFDSCASETGTTNSPQNDRVYRHISSMPKDASRIGVFRNPNDEENIHDVVDFSLPQVLGKIEGSETLAEGDDNAKEQDEIDDAAINLMENPMIQEALQRFMKMGLHQVLANSSVKET